MHISVKHISSVMNTTATKIYDNECMYLKYKHVYMFTHMNI